MLGRGQQCDQRRVAQLVEAPDLGSGQWRFESSHAYKVQILRLRPHGLSGPSGWLTHAGVLRRKITRQGSRSGVEYRVGVALSGVQVLNLPRKHRWGGLVGRSLLPKQKTVLSAAGF